MAASLAVGLSAAAQTWPQVTTRYFVVPASSSPNLNSSIQNVMDFQATGVIGLIPTDIATDPAALYQPNLLRVSEIIFTPASINLWEATNGPTGSFASENGQRLAWGVDWKDANTFLVSSIYFKVWSSDHYDTLLYAGNLATNTATG